MKAFDRKKVTNSIIDFLVLENKWIILEQYMIEKRSKELRSKYSKLKTSLLINIINIDG